MNYIEIDFYFIWNKFTPDDFLKVLNPLANVIVLAKVDDLLYILV